MKRQHRVCDMRQGSNNHWAKLRIGRAACGAGQSGDRRWCGGR
jgi:hypothetical protein